MPILGSADTPVQAGRTQFDPRRVLVTTTDSTEAFAIQFVYGEMADIAAKIAAEEMTEAPYIAATNNADSGIADLMIERAAVTTKMWARAICINQNAKTLNFYFGIHEYFR